MSIRDELTRVIARCSECDNPIIYSRGDVIICLCYSLKCKQCHSKKCKTCFLKIKKYKCNIWISKL